MKKLRSAIVKAIKEADRVRQELDADAMDIVSMDVTESEIEWRMECLNAERALIHRIISELYDVLGNTPSH